MAGRKRAASPSSSCASAAKKSRNKDNKDNKDKNKNNLPKPPVFEPPGVFPLLHFPAEIRNIIYDHVFTGTRTILKPSLRKTQPAQGPNLSLLYVCRQLYFETALLPYALMTFDFSSFTLWCEKFYYLKTFLQMRSRAQTHVLSDLRFRHEGQVERVGTGRYWMVEFGLPEAFDRGYEEVVWE